MIGVRDASPVDIGLRGKKEMFFVAAMRHEKVAAMRLLPCGMPCGTKVLPRGISLTRKSKSTWYILKKKVKIFCFESLRRLMVSNSNYVEKS